MEFWRSGCPPVPPIYIHTPFNSRRPPPIHPTISTLQEVRSQSGPSTMRPMATRPDALPLLLTAAETAQLLRTTRSAIYAMVERGQLPGVTRIGRRVLLRSDHLMEWLDQNRAPSPDSEQSLGMSSLSLLGDVAICAIEFGRHDKGPAAVPVELGPAAGATGSCRPLRNRRNRRP